MKISQATLRLRANSTRFERDVQRYLCPIYGVAGRIAEPIGSGFLLRLSSATLLITAAHVVYHAHRYTLQIPGQTRVVPIEGHPYSTGPSSEARSPDFGLDIAFVVLDLPAMLEQPSAIPTVPRDLDVSDVPAQRTAYGFVGIPLSKNRLKGSVFHGESYLYGGLREPKSTYALLGHRPATHFIMKFQRRAMINEAGNLMEVPDPHGMSGGPVFKLGAFSEIESGAAQPLVIAMGIEWKKERKVLVGVRIGVVVDCISQLLPQYAPELPQSPYFAGTATLV